MTSLNNSVTKAIKRLIPFSKRNQIILPYKICSEVEFRNAINLERGRANRDNHHFSVIVFDMAKSEGDLLPIDGLVGKIVERVRRIDLIGWYDNHRIGIVLPYTSDKGARKIVNDIYHSLSDSMQLPGCAVYAYPSKNHELIENEAIIQLRK